MHVEPRSRLLASLLCPTINVIPLPDIFFNPADVHAGEMDVGTRMYCFAVLIML
jgi:hypothetical protein